MRSTVRAGLAALLIGLVCGPVPAQEKIAPPTPPAQLPPAVPPQPAPPPPAATAVALTVNGEPIMELAVHRALRADSPAGRALPPEKREQMRKEVISFLTDNLLVDQYVREQKVAVDAKEVEGRVEEMRAQLKKQNLEFEKTLKEMMLTEAELRGHITAELRWEKFVNAQATEPMLRDLFGKSPDLFDGSMVHARHILLTPPANDAKASENARAQLASTRVQLEAAVAQAVAKLPPTADAATKQKERVRVLEEQFPVLAKAKSACPSKEQGGDVGWFPRTGSMVEPFAKAAFALKPYELSDVVPTQFGQHLILTVDRKAGKETKFEDVKDDVKDVYAGRLREAILAQQRPKAKIGK